MSFGFAIGDVLATLNLFERIAIELRNYRDAPARFQHLQTELELLRNTLHQVLQMEPEDESERECLDRLRATVMHCHQPLQVFLDKMRSKESSLGHYRSTKTLSSVGARLHWSMITQKDVDELRKIILSEMVAINMLLSVQQIRSLKHISTQTQKERSIQTARFDQQWKETSQSTDAILTFDSNIPDALTNLHSLLYRNGQKQSAGKDELKQDLASLSSQLQSVSIQSKSSVDIIRQLRDSFSRVLSKIHGTVEGIMALVQLLSRCSKRMLNAIARNTRLLLDISNQMKRILRAIEAIPLHLTLDIIRLDDALGESWALPLQACTTWRWQSFKNILEVIVYGNGRTGMQRILHDQFVILSAKTGKRIDPRTWGDAVKAGIHVQQAMTAQTDDRELSNGNLACPWPLCLGSIAKDKVCSMCGRWSMVEATNLSLIQVHDPVYLGLDNDTWYFAHNNAPRPVLPPMQLHQEPESILQFRRVYIYETVSQIGSWDEANSILQSDKINARANQYMGWWQLNQEMPENWYTAVHHLNIAAESDPSDSQTWYLLGRAYLRGQRYPSAYEALQQGIYRCSDCPNYWVTVGILYYEINQWGESLDAISRALQLNKMIWETWYNMGVVHSRFGQDEDAAHAFQTCLRLNPECHLAKQRLDLDNGGVGVLDELYEPDYAMVDCLLLHATDTSKALGSNHEFGRNLTTMPSSAIESV